MRQRTAGFRFSHTMQLFVFKMRRDLFFLPTVYPYKCVFETAPSVKIPCGWNHVSVHTLLLQWNEAGQAYHIRDTGHGIPQCLPLFEVSGQFFNGESFLPAYVRQVFPYVPAGSFLAFANRLPLPLPSHDAHRNTAIETAIHFGKDYRLFKFDFDVFILYYFVLI